MIVDSAVYRDGVRHPPPAGGLPATAAAVRAGDGIAWIELHRPSPGELDAVAEAFGLDATAVEDAARVHQRPRLERHGQTLLCVLRPARYIDARETVEFGELHVMAGPGVVVAVRHDDVCDLTSVREALEARPRLFSRGPRAVLHAILARVVEDYAPVVDGLENDIDEIEDEVFSGSRTVSRRIYELSREVIAFHRASKPLGAMLVALTADHSLGDEERRHLRGVRDHALRVIDQVDGFRQLLQSILNVNLTLETKALSEASIAQNDQVKRISAWAAILFAPTLIGTVYGMNFVHMPELQWRAGYPLAIAMMVATSLTLFLIFKRRDWI